MENAVKTRIHVNQHIVKRNAKGHRPEAPLTVKTYKENRKAWSVDIRGPSTVVYRPDNPLSCGARVWIETESEVIVRNRCEVCEGDGRVYFAVPRPHGPNRDVGEIDLESEVCTACSGDGDVTGEQVVLDWTVEDV